MLLLFLPSLFAWSISALKEPLFFLFTVCCVSLAVLMVRDRRWTVRIAALAGIVLLVASLQTIRDQGAVLTGGGIAAGLAIAWFILRPRAMAVGLVVAPLVIGAVLSRPQVQLRTYLMVQAAARQHWGHVQTSGRVYTLLDPRFYLDISTIPTMEFVDSARFVVRAAERYVTVPWPWEAQSAFALADLPEQILWYVIVALLPIGLLSSFRRDAVLTGVLFGTALVAAAAVAVSSGNVGTLVRHRSLALPYLVWLSMAGLTDLLSRAVASGRSPVLEKATQYGRS